MLDREDLVAVARAIATAIRQASQALETRLGVLERQSAVGIKSVEIRSQGKDRRLFVQTVTLVDGRKIESEFKLTGLMQYREIYQAGKYEMGDVVTYDGSMWVAIRDTDAVPGKSADWRLAVKRGQDGKNFVK